MKTEYQYKVISRLKKLREEKNYTQASLAKLLEISPGQLGNIESIKQEHKFTLAQILKICDALDIDIVKIFLPERGEGVNLKEVIEAIVKYQEGL
ncbi:MAG: helix-turn-helix transcriptional regulator [Alphaproteobacteria bacterium]|nr:helix-turn-helix transcriptional regulator [Alphaproteobacteria bacterium]